MFIQQYLLIFLIIPSLGLLASLLSPVNNEGIIAKTAFFSMGCQLLSVVVFDIYWSLSGFPLVASPIIYLYQFDDSEFRFSFIFDKISFVYLNLGAFLTFMITIYSRYYLHREAGYKRFYNTILFFYVGYTVITLSGNMETLFFGWEILGVSSFLLIAFYRHRYLPVKNAVKVYSLYRIGDAGLILSMWASHHFWNESINFVELANDSFVATHLEVHGTIGLFISLSLIVTAAIKSAQLPFSFWLPRAMEGPTPSSAIFYGSLSVHIGVFLLLRTFPFWEHQLVARILIGLMGLFTAFIANAIARVQSSVKSQIAYDSIAQIGIIFIEVALGFENIALFHITGNALLRTYQLLVSPSVVSYLIREQSNNFIARPATFEDHIPKKIENSLFILSLKEWNLENIIFYIYWFPLKWIGRKLDFVNFDTAIAFFIPTYLIGLFFAYHQEHVHSFFRPFFTYVFVGLGLLMVLKSFAEKKNVKFAWFLLIMNHLYISLGLSFVDGFNFRNIYIYMSGILLSGLVGFVILTRLRSQEKRIHLIDYQGYAYKHPKIGMAFFLACLGLSGFPITPTFIGEDLIFAQITAEQLLLTLMISASFIVDGLAIIRIFAKVFLGPHAKTLHEMSFKSA
jgi:NADH-quinone oxidoreductase subunit L